MHKFARPRAVDAAAEAFPRLGAASVGAPSIHYYNGSLNTVQHHPLPIQEKIAFRRGSAAPTIWPRLQLAAL